LADVVLDLHVYAHFGVFAVNEVLSDSIELRLSKAALFLSVKVVNRLIHFFLFLKSFKFSFVSFSLRRNNTCASQSLIIRLRTLLTLLRGANSFLDHEGLHVDWWLESTTVSRITFNCLFVYNFSFPVFLLFFNNFSVSFDAP